MTPVLADGERLIRDGAANMERGREAVGGRLFLTDRKLLFQSHVFNIQAGPSEIPLYDIEDVRTGWTRLFGLVPLVPNSIVVRHRGGAVARFVVFAKRQW